MVRVDDGGPLITKQCRQISLCRQEQDSNVGITFLEMYNIGMYYSQKCVRIRAQTLLNEFFEACFLISKVHDTKQQFTLNSIIH